jgi:hypothetical protein
MQRGAFPYAPPGPTRDGGRDRGYSDLSLSLLGPDHHFFNGERRQNVANAKIDCAPRHCGD